jgi:hypothetical protein
MAEVLMINPRKRRKAARKSVARKTTARRRRNPMSVSALSSKVRRPNPARRSALKIRRRRRNPIGGAAMGSINALLKDVAIQSAGAVGIDVLMGQVQKYLPASMKPSETVGGYDAIKAALTLGLGMLLSKTTKGLSRKMAVGALTTQVNDIAQTLIAKSAPSMTLGYANPARVSSISTRSNAALGRYSRGRSTLGMYNNANTTLGSRQMTAPSSAVTAQNAGYSIR